MKRILYTYMAAFLILGQAYTLAAQNEPASQPGLFKGFFTGLVDTAAVTTAISVPLYGLTALILSLKILFAFDDINLNPTSGFEQLLNGVKVVMADIMLQDETIVKFCTNPKTSASIIGGAATLALLYQIYQSYTAENKTKSFRWGRVGGSMLTVATIGGLAIKYRKTVGNIINTVAKEFTKALY